MTGLKFTKANHGRQWEWVTTNTARLHQHPPANREHGDRCATFEFVGCRGYRMAPFLMGFGTIPGGGGLAMSFDNLDEALKAGEHYVETGETP